MEIIQSLRMKPITDSWVTGQKVSLMRTTQDRYDSAQPPSSRWTCSRKSHALCKACIVKQKA